MNKLTQFECLFINIVFFFTNRPFSQMVIGTSNFSSDSLLDSSSDSKGVSIPLRIRLHNIVTGTQAFQILAQTYTSTEKSYRFQIANTQHQRFQILVQR